MAFKDLQFNIGKLTTNVKSQVARNNPLQSYDTRSLNLWLFEERNDLASMKTSAYHHTETNKAFLDWVKEEVAKNQADKKYSQDIEDVGSALVSLLEKQIELEKQYTDRYQLYRRAIKSIRDNEREIMEQKEKRQIVTERIQHLKKSNPSSKKLTDMEKELEQLDINEETATPENTADYKRFILKEAFYLRFNALQEFAEKTAIIAGFGKYLVDLLDLQLENTMNSDMILMDALLTVDGWQSSDTRQTLTKEDDLLHQQHEGGDDACLLSDVSIKEHQQKKKEALDAENEAQKEVNEKTLDNYYHQLYQHVSTTHHKKPLISHKSYAEFQNQFNPITSKEEDESAPPPAYTGNNTIDLDEKSSNIE